MYVDISKRGFEVVVEEVLGTGFKMTIVLKDNNNDDKTIYKKEKKTSLSISFLIYLSFVLF